MRLITLGLLLGGGLATLSGNTLAGEPRQSAPVIPGYGQFAKLDGAGMAADPSLRYRVVFTITQAAAAADKVNPSLNKVALFVNMLSDAGVRPEPGDIVAIVYGQATPIVAANGFYAAKTGAKENPNLDLIAKLRKAGVVVAVCSQALHRRQLGRDQLAAGVRIDESASITMATLQLRGWAQLTD